MCNERNPLHCVVPPHILRALLADPDAAVQQAALNTLIVSSRHRERRRVMGLLPARAGTGELRRTIYTAQNKEDLPGQLVRSEGEAPVADAAVNQAYDALGATHKLYQEVFQRNSIDGRGMPLDATVHYKVNYDNAFWDGQQMVFGDGDGRVFVGFTNAVDVVGHELAHGVTQFTANLRYHRQPGALNESFSDVFGSLVKQYALNQTADAADWLIGSGILAPGINGVALRSMAAPGTAYDDRRLGGPDPQPAHMQDFVPLPDDEDNDFGGVHINSGIPNHAFFLVATQLGGYAWEAAGHIWYQALQQLWSTAQFQDCANVTYQVAQTLYGRGSREQQAVGQAWSQVGITVRSGGPVRRGVAESAEPEELRQQLERLREELEATLEALGQNA